MLNSTTFFSAKILGLACEVLKSFVVSYLMFSSELNAIHWHQTYPECRAAAQLK